MAAMPCYEYHALKAEFALANSCRERSPPYTCSLLYFDGPACSANEKISEHSVLPIMPVLASFPLMMIQTCMHVFRVFSSEQMHFLALSVSKLLEDVLASLFKDEHSGICSIIRLKEAGKTLSQTRRQFSLQYIAFMRM